MDKKNMKVEITEIFMAKAGIGAKGFDRCFRGTIKREKTNDGTPIVRGKIHVKNEIHDCFLYSEAKDQWDLGDNLDQLVIMVLDKGLHNNSGKFFKRYGFEYHMN